MGRITAKALQLLLLAVVLAAVGLGPAQELASASSSTTPPPKPTYNAKCQKTAMSQIAMDDCVAGEVAQLNAEMKIALRDEAGQFGKGAVATVQQDWLRFEQAECRLEDKVYKGGTIQPLIYGVCELGLLVQRINEIDAVIRAWPH